jgi:hypothetical protein
VLFKRRHELLAGGLLSLSVLLAAGWEFILLDRTPSWLPWLRYAILIVGVGSGLLLLVVSRLARRAGLVIAAVALITGLAGPTAYAISTASTPHSGAIPTAGPAGGGGFGGPGGGRPGGGQRPTGGGFAGGPAGGGFRGGTAGPNGATTNGGGAAGATANRGTFGGGGAAGLLKAGTPSAAVVSALKANSANFTWVAAAIGSNSAAGYQLATQLPVMPIGGFNGSDPSPTLDQFKALVAAGEIHYFVSGGAFGGGGAGQATGGFGGGGAGQAAGGGSTTGGSSASSAISSWVQGNFKTVTIGGTTLYDLTQPIS